MKKHDIYTQEEKMSKYAKKVNQCLTRIKQGETSQFKELFDLTYNHLRSIAKLYLRDKTYCDDVVMETYERVIKYINSYNEEQDGYNWLWQITKRVTFGVNYKNSIFDNADEVDENISCDDFLDIANLKIDLDNVIDKLDNENKTIIILYYYMDMTYEEIAKQIGKTRSTVHKRIKNILKEIKNILQDGNFYQ